MAVTKVIVVNTQLRRLIDYAANKDKTGLEAAVSYITNPDKTEQRLFECAINCELPTAYEEMQVTKDKHKKTGGRLAYHIIQSFKPGEVTPEQAHNIGIDFARRCFGERYEVVIGTHLDKQHLHNHLVVNSVSFVDGKKYRDNFEDFYGGVRGISDSLCRKYGLSVIDNPQGHGKHYTEWEAENEGKPTIRKQIQDDIDNIIAASFTFKSFLDELKRRGYTVKYGDNIKYMAVRPPHSQKFIRLKSLGDDYTEETIRLRLSRQQTTGAYRKLHMQNSVRQYHLKGKPTNGKKLRGFVALYFRYLYMLGKVRKHLAPQHVSAYLREELIKAGRYATQFKFLSEHEIITEYDLCLHKESVVNNINTLIESRSELYRERSKANGESEKSALSEQISSFTNELRALRKAFRMCTQIEENAAEIRERAATARLLATRQREEVLTHEHRHRSR